MSLVMSSPNPRKRAAPGASPAVPIHAMEPFTGSAGDPLMRWNSAENNSGFLDDGSQALGSFMPPVGQTPHLPPATPSNVLARRQMNRALIPTNPRPHFDSTLDWSSLATAGSASMDQPANGEVNEEETMAQLEARALKARRDAEAKRKQIPPFVQKLASFLEKGKNQDLIRWSEKGDSFIVVDEDEFAKKLIPELFKHNNYASFVRQLNMYGFHKRVGLSDNSMRASERKGKSPNEYENKYFIRGRPNLLWLITKPKNSSKKKGAKNADGEDDSDDDLVGEETLAQSSFNPTQSGRALPPTDLGGLPAKKEFAYFRDEFRKIREHQAHILQRIQGLEQTQQAIQKEQLAQQHSNRRVDDIYKMYAHHEQLMKQMMQVLVYHFKKSVDFDDPATAQQLKDIMQAGFLPPGQNNRSTVFELSDEIGQMAGQSSSPLGALRRTRGLLEAPPATIAGNVSSAATTTAAATPAFDRTVTEIFDASPVDTTPAAFNLNSDHDELMNILHGSGTGAAAAGAQGMQNLTTPVVPTTTPSAQPAALSQVPPHMPSPQPKASRPRNPTVSAATPSVPASVPGGVPPVMASAPPVTSTGNAGVPISPPMPSIPPAMSNPDDLEELRRLQAETNGMISQMGHVIAPLSPSGRLPGLTDHVEPDSYFPPSNDFDISQFLDMDANNSAFDTSFLNFDQQDAAAGNGAPSPSNTEEITRDDFTAHTPTRGTKRRKVQ